MTEYFETIRVPCVIMRGGTSKAVFLMDNALPADRQKRDKVILSIFGSPDSRQIDGLGGADPLTSKLAIIAASTRDDADVIYHFGQVDIHSAYVDYSSNCGNISSAVGPFAITQGLVKAVEPVTLVRIYNVNTDKIFEAEVQVKNGMPMETGDYKVDGVPGTGSKILLNFANTVGSKTGRLLPTGNSVDELNIKGFGKIKASMVDAASPMVFVRASDLKLTGTEPPAKIDSDPTMLELLEEIRCQAAVRMGIVGKPEEAREKVRAVPLVAFVSPPRSYNSFLSGEEVSEESVSFVSRVMFMQVMHKAYSVTATVCTGAAAVTPGTIVNDVCRKDGTIDNMPFGHPGGIIEVGMAVDPSPDGQKITRAAVGRTARRIMEGYVFVPRYLFG